MKSEKVTQVISHIDEKYIDDATMFALKKSPSVTDSFAERSCSENQSAGSSEARPRRFRWGVAAVCVALIVVIGSAAFAFAAEIKEYNTAIAFFEKNGLSAEGLSRSDVKEVYRDIITKSFTYDKTADVIRQTVPGWEIQQNEPTPEELAAIWDKNTLQDLISQNGTSNIIFIEYGSDSFNKSILKRYQNGNLLWRAEFTDFYVNGYSHTKDGTAVWGWNETESSQETSYPWIALVDDNGNMLWQHRLNHGFANEYVASILSNGDGTWAVISRGDNNYLCLSCYDVDGKELSFHKTEIGNLGIWNAARLGDGYIVQLGNLMSRDTALLYKMDCEGNILESFSYEADDDAYYLTDMIEFGGHIYLSAYAVPKQSDEGGRDEIADILDYAFAKEDPDISSEELTPLVRDYYTAVLLICDPEDGIPKTFYSVKGSLGGKLYVNESDQLEWNVESVTSTFYSPATSSFTIGGSCKVFRYTFDLTGTLISETDTGDTVQYRR